MESTIMDTLFVLSVGIATIVEIVAIIWLIVDDA